MTAKTPGRASFEARQARRLGVDRTGAWDGLSMKARADEEVGAQAAIDWWHAERDLEPPRTITAPAPELAAAMAERDDLREQLAAALKRLDDLEDWTTMLIQRDEARRQLAAVTAERNRLAEQADRFSRQLHAAVLGLKRITRGEEGEHAPHVANQALDTIGYIHPQRDEAREQLAAADRATAEFRRQCSELAGELGAARAVVRDIRTHLADAGIEVDKELQDAWWENAGIGDGQ